MTSPDDLEGALRSLPAEAVPRAGWDPLPAARRYAGRRRLAQRAGALCAAIVVVAGAGTGYALSRGGGGPARLAVGAPTTGDGVAVGSGAPGSGGTGGTGGTGDGSSTSSGILPSGAATADDGVAVATPLPGQTTYAGPPPGGFGDGANAARASATPVTASAYPDPANDPALKPWASYPVDASPRVPIFTGETVLMQGFEGPDAGNAKEAWLSGDVTTPALSDATSTEDGYPTISSRAAFADLIAGNVPSNNASHVQTTTLSVSAPTLTEATFLTDRGRRKLPAWSFPVQDAIGGVIEVSALQPSTYGPQGSDTARTAFGGGVTLSADGRTLAIELPGLAEPTACDAGVPALSISESATAVAIHQGTAPPPTGNGGRPCTAAQPYTYVSVTLPSPLGNRVLVDGEHGAPYEVTTG